MSIVFEINGSHSVDANGKPQWPDSMAITMNKDEAWMLVDTLMGQLRAGKYNIVAGLVGSLHIGEEDNAA